MLDFLVKIKDDKHKKVSCTFRSTRRKDLMTKGGHFEAFYDDKTGLWSTDMDNLCIRVDEEIDEKVDEINRVVPGYSPEYMSIYNTGTLKSFINFVKDVPDKFETLDKRVVFANEETTREDYCAHKVDYILEPGDHSAWDKLIGTLYGPEDREKFEWAIGSLISGKSREIQKAIFVKGQPGRGKSTIFDIMQEMMPYHSAAFVAEDLGNESKQFAASAFAKNPLFAIDADAKLFNISATNRMNQIISHDNTLINEKFKAPYSMRVTTMLFMASNDNLDIKSSRSGLMRRIILIHPSGHTLPRAEYDRLRQQITFEYGAIAYHCLEVFNTLGEAYYDDLRDKRLLDGSNETYKFLKEIYFEIVNEPYVTINSLWLKFRQWLDQNNTTQVLHRKIDFENDIVNYFEHCSDRKYGAYKVLEGFKTYMFEFNTYEEDNEEEDILPEWLHLKEDISVDDNVLNKLYSDCLAQEADNADHPKQKWDNVKTTLKDIDTTKVHYVLPPEKHVIIDFDLKDAEGNKNLDLNLEAAKIFPPTYAEVSKGGAGLHLHYIYDGDPAELSSIYEEHIEVLSFKGKKALRRRLSLCNSCDFAVLKEGQLPKKEVKDTMVNSEIMMNEKAIRTTIIRCLRKEIHADTTSNIHMIRKVLDDAYASGIDYDVSDLKQPVLIFASKASNQSEHCVSVVSKLHFTNYEKDSNKEDPFEDVSNTAIFDEGAPIVFFDCEVFPNLFVICWKKQGDDDVISMINPTPEAVRRLFMYKLIGFNNLEYDNHILYARSQGYSIEALYKYNNELIHATKENKFNIQFNEARNISYTDVYDFASAVNKKGLKEWEVILDAAHVENSHPWDEPVPDDKVAEIVEYCCNDVRATELVFNHLSGDYAARVILAKLAGMTPNAKTNALTAKIILGGDKNAKSKFIYTDLSKEFPGYRFNDKGIPLEEFKDGARMVDKPKSIYRGECPSEGGYKQGFPGYYENVALLDISGMHPSTIIALNLFGDEYTARFKKIVDGRIAAKHIREIGDDNYNLAVELLGPVVEEYFDEGLKNGETVKYLAKNLSTALKTAVNACYGMTSAKFDNKLKDPRNKDNIVAKRGSLFAIELKYACLERGYTVVHLSTDSIKLANATPEAIEFVMDFGKKYGYTFEHEATYSKMVLVNNAVYICEVIEEDGRPCEPHWEATGKEFQIDYVFKKLFTGEEITFKDLQIVYKVQGGTALYLRKDGDDKHAHFVGRIGSFVPVKEEFGGAELVKSSNRKDGLDFATGSKGYLWAEAEIVKSLYADPMSIIDYTYFEDLCDEAIKDIEEYIPFDTFVGRG